MPDSTRPPEIAGASYQQFDLEAFTSSPGEEFDREAFRRYRRTAEWRERKAPRTREGWWPG